MDAQGQGYERVSLVQGQDLAGDSLISHLTLILCLTLHSSIYPLFSWRKLLLDHLIHEQLAAPPMKCTSPSGPQLEALTTSRLCSAQALVLFKSRGDPGTRPMRLFRMASAYAQCPCWLLCCISSNYYPRRSCNMSSWCSPLLLFILNSIDSLDFLPVQFPGVLRCT